MATEPTSGTEGTGARYYYPGNKILLPEWADYDLAGRKRRPLWLTVGLPILLLLLAGVGAYLFFWWLPARNVMLATVMVGVDADGNGEITEADNQGSGVIIHPDGYILTCRHVVLQPGESQIPYTEIWFRPGTKHVERFEATLVAAGEPIAGVDELQLLQYDWAVLQVARPGKLPYLKNTGRREFKEEEKIRATGFPRGWEIATNQFGPAVKILHGRITRVDRNDQQAPIRLTHDADLMDGMSGGPLTDRCRIIGINSAVSEELGQENYALPSYLLQEKVFDQYGKQ